MSRWSAKEEEALVEVKRRLKDQLANRPQFPEGEFNIKIIMIMFLCLI